MTRRVWIIFTEESRLPDRAASINHQVKEVYAQLSLYERTLVIGVMNARKTAWID